MNWSFAARISWCTFVSQTRRGRANIRERRYGRDAGDWRGHVAPLAGLQFDVRLWQQSSGQPDRGNHSCLRDDVNKHRHNESGYHEQIAKEWEPGCRYC